MPVGAAPHVWCRSAWPLLDGGARRGPEPASLLLPHLIMAMPASDPRMRNLVEDDITYLLFAVDTHERLREADDPIVVLRHPRPLARAINHPPPLRPPMGVHQLASERVYVQKIHTLSVGPISDTLRTCGNCCGWAAHEPFLWRKVADFRASSPGLSRLARTQSGRLEP